MPKRRIMSLVLVLLVAVPWSVAMSVVGLRVVFGRFHSAVLAEPGVSAAVGASALACGQLVFMLCVCDRVFPRASRWIVVPAESAMAAVFLGGMTLACLRVIS